MEENLGFDMTVSPGAADAYASSIVQIVSAFGEAPVGAGFAVAPRGLILTCAHVVAMAAGLDVKSERGPDTVSLVFAFTGKRLTGQVVTWSPYGKADLALIVCDAASVPELCQPLLLHEVRAVRGRRFRAYGFPEWYPGGLWGHGTLENFLISSGQIQISSTEIVPGFSGGPIQDLQSGRVIGIVSACDRSLGKAFAIPASTIQSAINGSAARERVEIRASRRDFDYLTRGMERLPDDPMSGIERFLREYLGSPRALVPFGGRSSELQSLNMWLSDAEQPFGIVAAPAGRGKSALVARWAAQLAAEEKAHVAFVPVSNRFGTSLKSQTVALWGARLQALSGVSERGPSAFTWDSAQWLGEIGAILRDGSWDAERPLITILDGLDEAADWDPGADRGNGQHALRDQVSATSNTRHTRLPVWRLGGVLARRLEQIPAALFGHGGAGRRR